MDANMVLVRRKKGDRKIDWKWVSTRWENNLGKLVI